MSDSLKSWSDFDFRTHLVAFQGGKKRLKKLTEEQIPKLLLGFDEVPFNYYSIKYSQKGQLVEHNFRQV